MNKRSQYILLSTWILCVVDLFPFRFQMYCVQYTRCCYNLLFYLSVRGNFFSGSSAAGQKINAQNSKCCIGICGEAELRLGTYNRFASQQSSKSNTPQTMVSVFNIMCQQWRIIRRCMGNRSLSFFFTFALRENMYSYMNGYWKFCAST